MVYTVGMDMMRRVAVVWGFGGVVALVVFALYRLIPLAGGMFEHELTFWHWLIFVAWTTYMGYSEGYKGFQKQFSPRVVARTQYLKRQARLCWYKVLLAPFFTAGYFGTTKRRKIVTYSLTIGIIILIIIIRFIPQPWRGILDGGVVFGLSYGLVTLIYWGYMGLKSRQYVTDPEVE